MAVGLTVGGWFESSVRSMLVTTGVSHLKNQYERVKGMKDELRRLEEALPQIQEVVEAAERGGQQTIDANPRLEAWLSKLKDAVCDADDVLDAIEYLQLKERVEAASGHQEHTMCAAVSLSTKEVVKFTRCAFNSNPTVNRLKEVVKRLDDVVAGVGNFLALVY